jgi:predicted ester cyclase
MNQYLILFREPDGRKDVHEPEVITRHRATVQHWMQNLIAEDRLSGGNALTLNGKVIKGATVVQPHSSTVPAQIITDGPHQVGTEIIGGYLLINATDLQEASDIISTCPILDFGGYAEVREMMPTTTSPDLLELNKSIVRRFNVEFIQHGNLQTFYDLIDPSVINHTAPPGASKGAEGMSAMILALRKALPDLTVELQQQVAENDLVVTRKAFHGTHQGALLGIPGSGKKITIPVTDIIRLRNGKYVEHWGIRDLTDLIQKAKD